MVRGHNEAVDVVSGSHLNCIKSLLIVKLIRILNNGQITVFIMPTKRDDTKNR